MSDEVDKKLYNHFKELIDGKIKTGNSVRDNLIVSDAKKHLADLMKKRPNTIFEEKENISKQKEKK